MTVNESTELFDNEIVIVDDAPDNLKLLSDMLANEGYTVFPANSGELALQRIGIKQPSLILLDVMMPLMDGFEVCRRLKAEEKTRDIPVIFISALDDEESKLAGFRAGGVDYICKPFRKEEVLARVRTQISLFRMQFDLKTRNERLQEEIVRRTQAELALEKRMIALTQPLEDSMVIAFDELFNVDNIQKLQDQFASAFGIASVITQTDGSPITKPSNFTNFCQHIIRCTEKGLKNCMHSDAVIGRHNQEGPIVMHCLSGGLWDAGASITVGGKHVANWLVGQVRDEGNDEDKLKKYAKEIGADEADFMRAFYEVPSMPVEQFHKISEVLFTMAGQLSDMSYQNAQQARFINAKKIAEEALKESEEKFRNFFENSPIGITITSPDAFMQINKAFCEMLGYSEYELFNKNWQEITHPDDIYKVSEVLISILKGKKSTARLEIRYMHKNGEAIWTDISTSLQRDNNNNSTYFITSVQDITVRKKVEDSLRKFKMGIDHSADAIFITEKNGVIEYINQAFEEIYGYPASEVIGQTPRILKSGLYSSTYYEQVWNKLLTKKPVAGEIQNMSKDGRLVSVGTSNNPILDDQGNIIGFISINRDITERKKAEQALKESEGKFRSLTQSTPMSICIYQGDYWVYTNPAGETLTGYTEEEMYQMKYWEIVAPEYQKMIKILGTKRLVGIGSENSFEVQIITKEGFAKWVYFTGSTIMYQGKPAGIISVVDISERKEAEETLLEAEEMMDAFFDQSLDGFFFMMLDEPIEWNGLTDKDLLLEYAFSHQRITKINQAMVDQYGATTDQYIGLTPNDMFAHDLTYGKRQWRKLFDNGKLHAETDERKLNGEQIILEVDYTCLYDSKSRITGHFGIQRDITQNKIALETIKNERKLLRTLIDHLPDAIYIKDKEGRKMVANRHDVENIGFFKEAQVLGKTDMELFDNEIGSRGYQDDLKVIETGEVILNRHEVFQGKNGHSIWLSTTKLPIFDQRGKVTGLVGIGRDITEQKKSQETIQKLSKSIEQSPSTIVITDIKGNIEYVNPKFTEITGYTLEEVMGKNSSILKSGEMNPETYKQLWDSISSGEVWRGEFLNRKKNGELYWEWATMTSLKNEAGTITNYIAIKEDISSRKQMEADLIVAKEKAEENDRLKSAFLANMSHEIRTPLNSIIGFSEILSDPDFESDQRYEFAQIITNSGNNLLAIISDIMDISKIEAGQVVVRKAFFSPQKLIQEIHDEYKIKALAKGIDWRIAPIFTDEDLLIESDQTKLKQVLINFVGNAIKFTEHGSIEIGLKVTGRSVQFYVKDTGIGIPVDYHARIFERFRQVEDSFTRKYGGNGLGLAISKSLIEMLGGTIGMESQSGKGSVFNFILPDVLK